MQVESGITKWSGRVPPLDLSAVSVCPRETERRWTNLQQRSPKKMMILHHQHTSHLHHYDHRLDADGLPIDPREWTRAHVWTWLNNMARSECLETSPDLAQKFPMNGKALCLMSLDMYLARVPVGGKMLYRDFRLRLARAMSLYK